MKFVHWHSTYISCSEYVFKHNLHQIKVTVYFRSAHCLIVLNMNWENDTRIAF